jgi:hypothetical protein
MRRNCCIAAACASELEGIRRIPAEQWRGELGFLAAISPTVHRLALEMSDRQATALAAAIAETDTVAPEIARLRGIALAGVFQIIITEAGRRTREGQSQNQIADELRPASKRSSTTSTPGSPQLRADLIKIDVHSGTGGQPDCLAPPGRLSRLS